MKFEVMKGCVCPKDAAGKTARRGVILFRKGGFVGIAPATTYSARTGRVPPGGLLLTNKSAAFPSSGFDVHEVNISIRDIYIVREDSSWMLNAEKVGIIDTDLDKRLHANMQQLMREFPPSPNCIFE